MDLEGEAEEAIFEDEDDIDDTAFENERCGICMDVVIDRGVLDCCHHWFCFACIDNWATITNLCPLCKNEFQLITCLPVYDTIGSIKVEEHLLTKDDDWRIQGKNNTLSFPSYYINEDAVVCLEGDGCKIRSRLSTAEEDSTFDTSIACDSCDIWYHAFCVEFNPENTSENSWLCPRCITDEVPQKSDGNSMQDLLTHSDRRADLGWSIDSSFSAKVSISVADAGETAVVVSMVDGEQRTGSSRNSQSESRLNVNPDKESETSFPDSDAVNVKLDMQPDKSGCIEHIENSLISTDEIRSNAIALDTEDSSELFLGISPEMAVIRPNVNLQEKSVEVPSSEDASSLSTVIPQNIDVLERSLALSKSQVAPLSSPYYSLINGDLKANITEETNSKHCISEGYKDSSPLSYDTSDTNEQSEKKPVVNLHVGLAQASSVSANKVVGGATENQMIQTSSVHTSEGSCLPDSMVSDTSENMVEVIPQKNVEISSLTRKHAQKYILHAVDADCVNNHVGKRKRDLQVSMETECHAKKARSDGKSQMPRLRTHICNSVSDNLQSCLRTATVSRDDTLRHAAEEEATTPDIMCMVQEVDRRFHDGPEATKSADKSLGEKGNAAGLRVKKIMRRVGDKKESSILVQELRKEIREAVVDKACNSIGKDDVFDGKLLAAFRAAIVQPRIDLVNKLDPSLVGVRKSLLQKGKIRGNLTKKIYGTSSGRRRRAWDRDWEIEFWKHRCTKSKPEKVETLQSVLELLKRSLNSCSENSEIGQGREGEPTNSILSRVYLADASVFPRKDDIKPLSALAEFSVVDNLERNKENNFDNLSGKEPQPVRENNMAKKLIGSSKSSLQVKDPSSDNTGNKFSTPSFKGEVSFRRGHSDGLITERPTVYGSSGSKGRDQNSKELPGQSDAVKIDKRKWALDVLARKNALTNTDATKGKEENRAVIKGNYPLLAQLPTDMRPVLAPSRHNKVPVSVRQAQLYRITEHYLRRANLPVIRRTADTELAVADAINVEKEIFERSNSKLVYINLCSQVLAQHTNKPQTAENTNSAIPAEGTDQVVEEDSSDPATTRCNNVEEALKMAGLSSDSPPNSPHGLINGPDEDAPLVDVREENLENVLDIDSHPEMDIYGDFVYDLEDEGYIISSSMVGGVSKLQPEDGDSRMKVVFSTLNCEKPDSFLDSKDDSLKPCSSEKLAAVNDHDKVRIDEVPPDSPIFIDCQKEKGMGNAALEVRADVLAPVLEPSQGEIYKEPSVAECEELYGPEKEPLAKRKSNEVIGEMSNCLEMEATLKSTIPFEAENNMSMDLATTSEFETESCAENNFTGSRLPINHESFGGENSPTRSLMSENAPKKEGRVKPDINRSSDSTNTTSKKVEAYIKEHIRPLCKSGVITAEQYRWAVGKTTEKVMKYHFKDKNANFLIKEGNKVKKLAEQYVEAAQQKERV